MINIENVFHSIVSVDRPHVHIIIYIEVDEAPRGDEKFGGVVLFGNEEEYSLGLKSSKAAGSFGSAHSDQLGNNFARVQELYLLVETAHLLAEGSAESKQDHLPHRSFSLPRGLNA
jgi:hypothetical protein